MSVCAYSVCVLSVALGGCTMQANCSRSHGSPVSLSNTHNTHTQIHKLRIPVDCCLCMNSCTGTNQGALSERKENIRAVVKNPQRHSNAFKLAHPFLPYVYIPHTCIHKGHTTV